MTRSSAFNQPVSLVPINLRDQNEIEEMIQQRKICGWDYEMSDIEKWREQIERGVKFSWWIVVPNNVTADPDASHSKRAGHVSMASEASPPDEDLARSDCSIMTVSSFFVLPEYRGSGIGRASWLEVEERVRQIPECKQIAIDTWDRRYSYDDGPEWGGLLKAAGRDISTTLVNEDWYARMGYQKFKSVPRYPIPGRKELQMASCMRKNIK